MRPLNLHWLVQALRGWISDAVTAPVNPGGTWGGPRHRGQPSLNHAKLAARSHAGKPSDYVKAY